MHALPRENPIHFLRLELLRQVVTALCLLLMIFEATGMRIASKSGFLFDDGLFRTLSHPLSSPDAATQARSVTWNRFDQLFTQTQPGRFARKFNLELWSPPFCLVERDLKYRPDPIVGCQTQPGRFARKFNLELWGPPFCLVERDLKYRPDPIVGCHRRLFSNLQQPSPETPICW